MIGAQGPTPKRGHRKTRPGWASLLEVFKTDGILHSIILREVITKDAGRRLFLKEIWRRTQTASLRSKQTHFKPRGLIPLDPTPDPTLLEILGPTLVGDLVHFRNECILTQREDHLTQPGLASVDYVMYPNVEDTLEHAHPDLSTWTKHMAMEMHYEPSRHPGEDTSRVFRTILQGWIRS